MKQEDGKGIGDPVHKYYFFPSEARDFSRGYFTLILSVFVSSLYGMVYRIRHSLTFVESSFLPIRESVSDSGELFYITVMFPPYTGGCIVQELDAA